MSTSGCPPWVLMWGLATAVYAGCKLVTWAWTPRNGVTAGRQWGYLLAWPGMDPKAFFNARPIPASQRPVRGEWVFAAVKFLIGGVITWGLVPFLPEETQLVRGWVGMFGLVFLLHFGLFHVLSCAWRSAGVDAKPLMNWPILSTSLSEFWGRRWNTAFRDLTYRFLFRPLSTRLGPKAGLAVGFLASGVVHDLVVSVPAGGGYGWPTLYFVLQGLGLLVERSAPGRRFGLGRGGVGWVFTFAMLAGPAFALFHPPFVTAVILPFLAAVGAG